MKTQVKKIPKVNKLKQQNQKQFKVKIHQMKTKKTENLAVFGA